MIKKVYLYSFFSLLMLFACEDLNTHSSIPNYVVYLSRNVNMEAIELRTIGGYKTYTTTEKLGDAIGYGGILIIYGFDEEYHAYDMTCPYELSRTVRVTPNSAGQAVCSTCGSIFNIAYGMGNCISGPSKEGLKRYKVIETNTSSGLILTVTQ